MVYRDPSTLVQRLREACKGYRYVKIPWPHRILHEAADRIEELEAQLRSQSGGEEFDLYTVVASVIFNMPEESVTLRHREHIKKHMYVMLYGGWSDMPQTREQAQRWAASVGRWFIPANFK